MSEYQPQMAARSAVELLVSVVDVPQSEKVLRLYRDTHVLVDLVCMAHGTAKTEMLDLLGIGETAKAIVLCLTDQERARLLLDRLGHGLQMRYPGKGIAFTVPINGIGVRWHRLLTQMEVESEGAESMSKSERACGLDAVVVVMERGYTNVAMDAARKAGARGGTVIAARGIAEDEVKRFFGIEIQAEKEIVFLIVRSEERQEVMTALMKAVGMNTRSHGLVLSVPLSSAIGLAD
ncbi:hypothetical protein [uncultured Agathobaculum sp.]|uniref:hypothetical protein n=1 Tax=uncultured Agathobaculum sp. TaxID=2048140 RepID=UPI00320991E5